MDIMKNHILHVFLASLVVSVMAFMPAAYLDTETKPDQEELALIKNSDLLVDNTIKDILGLNGLLTDISKIQPQKCGGAVNFASSELYIVSNTLLTSFFDRSQAYWLEEFELYACDTSKDCSGGYCCELSVNRL